MDTKNIDPGYNRIKPWLKKKLEERHVTVEKFCILTGRKIEQLSIWRWYSDVSRPRSETMKIVCETLSRLPIKNKDGSEYLEYVPWSEGLATYKPKPRAWAAHYLNKPTPEKQRKK